MAFRQRTHVSHAWPAMVLLLTCLPKTANRNRVAPNGLIAGHDFLGTLAYFLSWSDLPVVADELTSKWLYYDHVCRDASLALQEQELPSFFAVLVDQRFFSFCSHGRCDPRVPSRTFVTCARPVLCPTISSKLCQCAHYAMVKPPPRPFCCILG
jgi:hypothetical protein